MGANLSMDISAALPSTAPGSSPLLLPMLTPTPEIHAPLSIQDKTRLDTLLIPEDLVDIHIEGAAAAAAVSEAAEGATLAENGSGGDNKRRKRHGKKKQNETTTTTVPIQIERTIEQRREQVRPIIDKLTELQMNISYPAIRELYKQLNQFVKTGEDSKIKIQFPEFSRRIKGELTNAVYKPCWVKLEMM
ncbi:MAG: hypothetical protein EBU66_14650 [Bacteroidetes bacterium]|nr:hypothetical protein [bacterium]NBP65887.1 hypothetical protein [Bacteroidota bacterium]